MAPSLAAHCAACTVNGSLSAQGLHVRCVCVCVCALHVEVGGGASGLIATRRWCVCVRVRVGSHGDVLLEGSISCSSAADSLDKEPQTQINNSTMWNIY